MPTATSRPSLRRDTLDAIEPRRGDRGSDRGILLVNLGTPDSPTPADVRSYLAEFLSDPLVIDIPAPLRFLLLHFVILPFRPRRAAAAYRKIWTSRGSPLRFHGEDLTAKLQARTGRPVALAMRYGRPDIASALDALAAAGAHEVQVFLLFPQYSESAWETAAREVRRHAERRGLELSFVPPFYAHRGFLGAAAVQAQETLARFPADHVLFSFHGLPERHVRKTDPSGRHCLATARCCDAIVEVNRACYRAQCVATARGLASRLGLDEPAWSIAFQSRLGRTPWIRPFTDERILELARSGCRRLAVACPSFVADCLETLEEIQIRAHESFVAHGGEDLRLIPAVNSSDGWVEAVVDMLEDQS